jgi:dihydrofolate reductase
MGQVVALESVSLDGVAQAPGGADEDTRGGFTHGGWAAPYGDEVIGRELGKGMAEGGALLFGRRTYEQFHGFWPAQTGNPFTPVLDAATKYVASRTLSGPLPWVNSTLLAGEATATVPRLDEPVLVLGSTALVRSLAAADLVDRYVLLVHPLLLGGGTRLFADRAPLRRLTLESTVTSTTGVIMATYVRSS